MAAATAAKGCLWSLRRGLRAAWTTTILAENYCWAHRAEPATQSTRGLWLPTAPTRGAGVVPRSEGWLRCFGTEGAGVEIEEGREGESAEIAAAPGNTGAGAFNEGSGKQKAFQKELARKIYRSYPATVELYERWKAGDLSERERELYGAFNPSTAIFNHYLRAKCHCTKDINEVVDLVLQTRGEGVFISSKTFSVLIGFSVRHGVMGDLFSSGLIDKTDERTYFEYFLRSVSTSLYHQKIRQAIILFEREQDTVFEILGRDPSVISKQKKLQYDKLKNEFVLIALKLEAWGALGKILAILDKKDPAPLPLAYDTVCQLVARSAYSGHMLLKRAIKMMWTYEADRGEKISLDYGTAYYLLANTTGNRNIHYYNRVKIADWVWERIQPIGDQVPLALFYARINAHSQGKDFMKSFDVLALLDEVHPRLADPYQMQMLTTKISGIKIDLPNDNSDKYADCEAALDGVFDWLVARREEENGLVTASCVNALIAACGKAKDLSRAFEAFEMFSDFGLEPDIHSYTLLMDVCLTTRRFDAVLKLAEEIESKHLAMTARTSELLVLTALKMRDVFLLNEFLNDGVQMTEKLMEQIEGFLAR